MNRLFAALVLVMVAATSGCSYSPHVDKGGGESAALLSVNGRPTGTIAVQGHVVNTGDATARDVVLSFTFFQDGVEYLQGQLLVGKLAPGESASFSGTFPGPPVHGVFTWDYRIDWD